VRRGFVLVGVLPLVAFGQKAARSEPADGRTQIRGEKGERLALGGRVLDPDGAPMYPFVVSALPESFERLPCESAPRAGSDDLQSDARADRDGAFVLRDLPPGRYTLVGAFLGARPSPLGSERFDAGTRDACVEARVHRVSLRVLDHQGNTRDVTTWAHRAGRVGDPVLVCRRHGLFAENPALADLALPRFELGDETVVPVEPGDELDLAFVAPEIPLVERRLRVPSSPWLVRVELRLPPPVAPAHLSLHLRLRAGDFGDPVELSLLTASGLDVTGAARFDGPVLGVPVAPGTYRLRVRPMDFLSCWQGDPDELVPEFAPFETEVELASGRQTSIDVALRRNARLRLALELPRRGDPDAIARAFEDERDYREPLFSALGGARVELEPAPHGTVLRPEFSVEVPEQRALPALRLPGVAPGRACTSITAIPPGAYRVRVALDDGRTLERVVALAEGATTLVTLAP